MSESARGQGNNRVQLSGDEYITVNTLYDGTAAEGQSTTISWRNNKIFNSIEASLAAPSPVEITLNAENFQGNGLPWTYNIVLSETPQPIIGMFLSGQGQATLHYTLNVPKFMAPGTYPITVNFEITK